MPKSNDILYSRKIWLEIKFGGLADGLAYAKLKSTNTKSYWTVHTQCNCNVIALALVGVVSCFKLRAIMFDASCES